MRGRQGRSSRTVPHAATRITAPDTDPLPAYWQFPAAVTLAQLTAWLPSGRHLIVDVSGPRGPGAELAARAGHIVLRVTNPTPNLRENLFPQDQGGSGGARGSGG